MSSTWRERALKRIIEIHKDMPTATAADLRKELRRHSGRFSQGTSWGARVWPSAVRQYLLQQFGERAPQRRVEDSPLFGPDITFPFRKGADK